MSVETEEKQTNAEVAIALLATAAVRRSTAKCAEVKWKQTSVNLSICDSLHCTKVVK